MDKTSKKTKYTLYKPEPGVQRPCAFFNSDAGCKNGDSCPFLHSTDASLTTRNEPAPVAAAAARGGDDAAATTKRKKEKKEKKDKTSKHAHAAPAVVEPVHVPAAVATHAQQGDGRPAKRCTFYGTLAGCKKGAACPFLHIDDGQSNGVAASVTTIEPQSPNLKKRTSDASKASTAKRQKNAAKPTFNQPKDSSSSSSSSSESSSSEDDSISDSSSSDDDDHAQPAPVSNVFKTPKKQVAMVASSDEDDDDSEEERKAASRASARSKRGAKVPATPDDEQDFLFGAVNTALHDSQIHALTGVTPKTKILSNTPATHESKKRKQRKSDAGAENGNQLLMHGGRPQSPAPTVPQPSTLDIFLPPNAKPGAQPTKQPKTPQRAQQQQQQQQLPAPQFPQQVAPQPAQPLPPQQYFVPAPGMQPMQAILPLHYMQQQQQQQQAALAASPAPQQPQLVQPMQHVQPVQPVPSKAASAKASKWEPLLQRTVSNPRYAKDYQLAVDSTWIRARPYGPWAAHLPSCLAIDCEMCETTDPVTGQKDGKTLIRLSVVNGDNKEEVLIDTLISPGLPVTDYRTHIHGITPSQLAETQITLRQAQAALLQICHSETVLIGHSLSNDLKAMHLDHPRIVDTAMIYQLQGQPNSAPSLRQVVKAVLSTDMPTLHDSVNDARMALVAAEHLLNASAPIEQVQQIPAGGSSKSAAHTLLVHRIPATCTEEHLKFMFEQHARILPLEIPTITRNETGQGRVVVTFSTAEHANLAFESISGVARPDKTNRLQKRIYLRQGDYIQVRKMV